MAFAQDGSTLYVAQLDRGIAAVSPSGSVDEIITSNTAFTTVATEASGDLLVTVDSDSNIYRIDMDDVVANPTIYKQDGMWMTRAAVAYDSSSSPYIYSLAEMPDGTIYYSTYQDRQINVISNGVSTPLLTESFDSDFVGFSLLPDGGLGALARGGVIYEISAAQLASGSVAPSALKILTSGVRGYGFAAMDGNFFYDGLGTKRTFEGAPAVVPDAPTGLTATTGDSEVTLNWEAPQNDGGAAVTEYTVFASSGDDEFKPVTRVDTTTAKVTRLENGKSLDFVVSAWNSAGESAYSDSVTATPYALDVTFMTGDTLLTPDSSVEPGQTVTATGSALPPGAALSLELHPTPVVLAVGVVDTDGTFTVTGTIRSSSPAGAHTLVLMVTPVGEQARSAEQAVTVLNGASGSSGTPAPSPGTPQESPAAASTFGVNPPGATGHLAATGTDDPEPALTAAAFLVALGLALSVLSRVHARRG